MVVINSDYLAGSFSFNTFYIAIYHFYYGYGIVAWEIRLVFIHGILNESRGHDINPDSICQF